MSAICGIIRPDGRPIRACELSPVLDTLAGLGLDGQGTWTGQVGRLTVAVGLRLRRRVLSDAAAVGPQVSADGQVIVVADVVLDNRVDLVRLLGIPDRPEVCDGALVLAAYQRWGRRCPEHLLGSFAFAVIDRAHGGVLVVRDHVGDRPLHLHQRPEVVAFASTALALTAVDGVGHELDEVRLAEFLTRATVSTRGWISQVSPVQPATAVWIDEAGTRTTRYWHLDVDRRVDSSPEWYARQQRAVLDTAVHARITRAVGGVAVLLSGGLDSTSIAASAAVARPDRRVHTYTSVPPPDWDGVAPGSMEADESRLVTDLARWYPNLVPTFVNVRGASPLDGLERQFELGATPVRHACNTMWIYEINRRAAGNGVTTVLNGYSGNPFYSADDRRWLRDLLRAGRLSQARSEALATARGQGVPLRNVVGGSLRGGSRPDMRRAAPTMVGGPQGAEARAVQDALHGLRTTDPTADVRVIELCAAQPAWIRHRDGISRAACRAAMAGRLPDSIRLRTVRGLQLADWADRLADSWPEVVAELTAMRSDPVCQRVVDFSAIDPLVRAGPTAATGVPSGVDRRDLRKLMSVAAVGRYVRWFNERGRARVYVNHVPTGAGDDRAASPRTD